jgi:hypothetical protein
MSISFSSEASHACSGAPHLRIEDVIERIAGEVEAEDGEKNRGAR